MRKLLASAVLALAGMGAAPAPAPTRSMTCTKTGAQVDSCCCVEKDGTMVRTLTGEAVDSCSGSASTGGYSPMPMKSRIQPERAFPVASRGFCKTAGRERKASSC